MLDLLGLSSSSIILPIIILSLIYFISFYIHFTLVCQCMLANMCFIALYYAWIMHFNISTKILPSALWNVIIYSMIFTCIFIEFYQLSSESFLISDSLYLISDEWICIYFCRYSFKDMFETFCYTLLLCV